MGRKTGRRVMGEEVRALAAQGLGMVGFAHF